MKKIVGCIALVLVLLACCLPLLLFVGFGYLEYGGSCVYKGPLASADGACSNNPSDSNNNSNESTKVYSNSAYQFSYPSSWSVEPNRNGLVYVYPDSGPQGQNMNINNQQFDEDVDINQAYCNDYTSSFTSQLEGAGYSNVEVINSDFTYLNSYPSCLVEFSGVVSGKTIYQKQYVFDDPQVSGDTFYLTVTVFSEDQLNIFDSVIDSFEIL